MIDTSVDQTVLFAGDSHGDRRHALGLMALARKADAQIILHTGDWGFMWHHPGDLPWLEKQLEEWDMEMWWVDGNHENYSMMSVNGCDPVGETDAWPTPHIRYLPRGFRFGIGSVSFMSFGGAVSVDRDGRRSGVTWWDQETIKEHQVDAVEAEPVDVMLTHDAPDSVPVLDERLRATAHYWPESALRDADYNRRLLGEVVDKVQPKLLVHGHYHYKYIDKRVDTHVVGLDCNGNLPSSYAIFNTRTFDVSW